MVGTGPESGGCACLPAAFPRPRGPAALTHAFQQVPVVVEALLAIALVAGLRVHALALLADLRPKQYAFVDVCGVTGRGRPRPLPAGPLRPRSRERVGGAYGGRDENPVRGAFPNADVRVVGRGFVEGRGSR